MYIKNKYDKETSDMVVELLGKLEGFTKTEVRAKYAEVYISSLLENVYATMKALHIINNETVKENSQLSVQLRYFLAGQAMSGMLAHGCEFGYDGKDFGLAENAFYIADEMISYGKKDESKDQAGANGDTESTST